MTLIRLALLASLLALVGCATPVYNYQPATVNISEPPLGTVIERQIGEDLLRQGKYIEHEAIRVLAPLKPVWAYTLMPGYFLKTGQDENGEFFRIGGAGDESGYIEKSPIADPFKAVMVRKDDVICVITFINAAGCSDVRSGYERTRKPVISADAIQRTLIYNGKVGNKINIGYREFSSNIARPAFNNNVEYDLSESTEIGYKGARVEILEATNRSIKYRVISNFNAAER
jgi:hypothetical protein